MARFNRKKAVELVKLCVQIMTPLHPIVSNGDIDKYISTCREILRLKYNDTRALRNFIEDFGPDGMGVLIINTYNEESPSQVLLDDSTISAVNKTLELWF
jgi:hypothetical protein